MLFPRQRCRLFVCFSGGLRGGVFASVSKYCSLTGIKAPGKGNIPGQSKQCPKRVIFLMLIRILTILVVACHLRTRHLSNCLPSYSKTFSSEETVDMFVSCIIPLFIHFRQSVLGGTFLVVELGKHVSPACKNVDLYSPPLKISDKCVLFTYARSVHGSLVRRSEQYFFPHQSDRKFHRSYKIRNINPE